MTKNKLPKWDLLEIYLNYKDPKIEKDITKIKVSVHNFVRKWKDKIKALDGKEISNCIKQYERIKGIELAPNDQIVSLSVLDNDKTKKNGKKSKDDKSEIKAKERFVLSISENGFGKKTSHTDYRVTNRGGKGIIGIVNSPRNGNITSSFPVYEGDEIIISTNKGRVIRVAVKEIRTAGRNTQGVRIIKLSGEEKVVSSIKIDDNLI